MDQAGSMRMAGIGIILVGGAVLIGGIMPMMQDSMSSASTSADDITCTTASLAISSLDVGNPRTELTVHNDGKQEFDVVTVRVMRNTTVVGRASVRNLSGGAYRNVAVAVDGRPTHVVGVPADCPGARAVRGRG
ncbi:MAG: hypothetical protein SVW02_00040 [Candidatus Nanohaloarchaea archaeon]|nr:hypothetical protein [Candidatus Nanohaloarchaea archaeon]